MRAVSCPTLCRALPQPTHVHTLPSSMQGVTHALPLHTTNTCTPHACRSTHTCTQRQLHSHAHTPTCTLTQTHTPIYIPPPYMYPETASQPCRCTPTDTHTYTHTQSLTHTPSSQQHYCVYASDTFPHSYIFVPMGLRHLHVIS